MLYIVTKTCDAEFHAHAVGIRVPGLSVNAWRTSISSYNGRNGITRWLLLSPLVTYTIIAHKDVVAFRGPHKHKKVQPHYMGGGTTAHYFIPTIVKPRLPACIFCVLTTKRINENPFTETKTCILPAFWWIKTHIITRQETNNCNLVLNIFIDVYTTQKKF